MSRWQHAHLVVTYIGEHAEVTGRIFNKTFQAQEKRRLGPAAVLGALDG
ncbi:hypothetical protein ACQP2Y_28645 [Actinoplanes sp. CA-051413]